MLITFHYQHQKINSMGVNDFQLFIVAPGVFVMFSTGPTPC